MRSVTDMSSPSRSIWIRHAVDAETSIKKMEVLSAPPGRFNSIVTVADGGGFEPVIRSILCGKGNPVYNMKTSMEDELARRRRVALEGDDDWPCEEGLPSWESRGPLFEARSHQLRRELLPCERPHACHVRWIRGEVGGDNELDQLLDTAAQLSVCEGDGDISHMLPIPQETAAARRDSSHSGMAEGREKNDQRKAEAQVKHDDYSDDELVFRGQDIYAPGINGGAEPEVDPTSDEFLSAWTCDPMMLCLQALELERRTRKETGVSERSRKRVELYRERAVYLESQLERGFTRGEIKEASRRAVEVRCKWWKD